MSGAGVEALLDTDSVLALAPGLDRAKVTEWVTDVVSRAITEAPCLTDPELPYGYRMSVRGLLRAAVLRRAAQEGMADGIKTRQETAGPFGLMETVDTTDARTGILWPSEIKTLQEWCRRWAEECGRVRRGGRAGSVRIL